MSTDTEFSDLKACFVNCTLKASPETSNTQGLMDNAIAIMRANGVTVDTWRAVDYDLAPGVYPDMRTDVEGGKQDTDDWPMLKDRVLEADILVIGTPIWLGDKSSVATRLIERLYALSGQTNDRGQFVYYGRTAGVLVTGNEDGIKHVAMNVLYSLQHIGYTIPPNADAGWVGEAGPGPSYLDKDGGGTDSDFTRRNTAFMAWNLMHAARWLKDSGGYPAGGNSTEVWSDGARFDHPNPEYRA